MPTNAPASSNTTFSSILNEDGVACPLPLTPPPDVEGDQRLGNHIAQERSTTQYYRTNGPMNNNTALGMSIWQEDTLYGNDDPMSEKVGTEVEHGVGCLDDTCDSMIQSVDDSVAPDTPVSIKVAAGESNEADLELNHEQRQRGNNQSLTPEQEVSTIAVCRQNVGFDATTVDKELDQNIGTREWDFSSKRIPSECPSSLFQNFSKYKGTQQSDKQIYNVEVTILTVDIDQSTLSGYLQICGLTPDHPTLTTFFTGEIIGGPNQKYSFRTNDSEWGANSKIDVTHWTRFPAWKSLSSYAKKDINFVYPLNHESWWQQEHVFMRWKEHFLVPDHKLKSIQGASFEGFYYICLNQVEGKISGIYFHSKSEKYQQLELKHEGKQGAWGKGGCCSSRPVESDITRQDDTFSPRVRQSNQAITSRTAINHATQDRPPRSLNPHSGISLHRSETSRSALSTPQHPNSNNPNLPEPVKLAEHYNLPLKSPKSWTSTSRTWTYTQLERERYEFFETRVTGRPEVWEALRQVAECIREDDIQTAQGILDAVGVTLPTGYMEDGCYDEVGNLYKIPEAVLRDPTNVVTDAGDASQDIVGKKTVFEHHNDEDDISQMVENKTILPVEKLREDKGKAAIDKDALKIKCRLSDRGGPDVIVLLGRSQNVRVLIQRIRDEGEVPDTVRIKIAYLGKIFNENETLLEQGWKEGHVINALIVGSISK